MEYAIYRESEFSTNQWIEIYLGKTTVFPKIEMKLGSLLTRMTLPSLQRLAHLPFERAAVNHLSAVSTVSFRMSSISAVRALAAVLCVAGNLMVR